MRLIATTLAALVLAGCASTWKGIQEDAERLAKTTQPPARTAPAPVSDAVPKPVAAPPAARVAAPQQLVTAPPIVDPHASCESPRQVGCFTFWVTAVRNDALNPVFKGLDRPYANQKERQERAELLGSKLLQEVRAGKVKAAKPRSFLILVWDTKPVSLEKLAGWRLSYLGGKPQYVRTTVEEVFDTGRIVFDETAANLGKPQRVFRIRTDGVNTAAAGIQLPWSVVTEGTHVLICDEKLAGMEKSKVVYPPGKDLGLWVTPPSLMWLKGKDTVGRTAPFVVVD